MSKVNTLFTYFTKSPKNKDVTSKALDSGATVKREIKESTPLKRNVQRQNNDTDSETPSKVSCPHQLHDLVWAKLDGYPYWPALVCCPPNGARYLDDGKPPQIHVQFFDSPPSRSWVKLKRVKPLTGPNHPEVPKMRDPEWQQGVQDALSALEMHRDKRAELVVFTDGTPLANSSAEMDAEDDPSENGAEDSVDDSMKENSGNFKKPPPKRRRIIVASESEGSDDDYKPEVSKGEGSESDSMSSGVDESKVSEPEPDSDDPESPIKKTPKHGKRKRDGKATSTPQSTSKKAVNGESSTKSRLLDFASPKAQPKVESVPSPPTECKVWAHLNYDFLKEGKRRDAHGRLPNHPDFQPRTLSVPESFKKNLTPAMRQWWDMKSQHFDVVLFFKVGKFYELYHMDAVIGVEELGLVYMKGEFAHSGFPEISYGRYSESLVQKGYKVARVEQTETPQAMEERCKKMHKPTKFDKVVKREICRITSLGTRTFGIQDGQVCEAMPSYLLAFAEKSLEVGGSGESIFGVCFVDTSVGTFHMGQFSDDRYCSKFRTMIAHYGPVQVLYESGQVTGKTRQILDGTLSAVLKEGLRPWKEFWDAPKTLQFLRDGRYFEADDGNVHYPEALLHFLDQEDKMLQTASDGCELAVKALGACIWYLSDSMIEEELLTMRKFEVYTPQASQPSRSGKKEEETSISAKSMILDGVSLQNLEVLRTSSGTLEGTLIQTMDYCCTPFGKRLFRQWLCAPACQPAAICDRQDAVEDLLGVRDEVTEVRKQLQTLPDLERLLAKVHTQGLARKNSDHPECRAVFYEDTMYNKRKVANLLLALQGLKTAADACSALQAVSSGFLSKTLSNCIRLEDDGGRFPDLSGELEYFDKAFDHEEARRDGKIMPRVGVDKDYDSAMSRVEVATKALDNYLAEQCKHFRCKVTYCGSGKNRFQMEVPEAACKLAGASYDIQGQRKGYRRYWTPRIKELMTKLVSAEEAREAALADIMRRMFESFDKRRKLWEGAVQCLSVLDCLISLAEYSASLGDDSCRPVMLTFGKPRLCIRGGRHPCLTKHVQGDSFVPNDVSLGDYYEGEHAPKGASIVLITGPNMGGKSTLMRQTGLIVIIAQMGARVPAEMCEFSPVDRIFTRLGASDRITSGESTFFVEVNETSAILKYATFHSLVLLDELGRGTSTHDGMAIAHAVVKELSRRIGCRTLFSTHYHHLVEEFGQDPSIYLGHMACMVENENADDPTEETIRFLYKFVRGACPKSYGFNAAMLAGISVEIVRKAFCKSKALERAVEQRRAMARAP